MFFIGLLSFILLFINSIRFLSTHPNRLTFIAMAVTVVERTASEEGGTSAAQDASAPTQDVKRYDSYVSAQLNKTDPQLKNSSFQKTWVSEEQIAFLANYLKDRLPFERKFALCHGTRAGVEQQWFRKFLPGIEVFGTELSDRGKQRPFTIVADFHIVKEEWVQAADFVYTNSWDHTYNLTFAVEQWMQELSPLGALVLHWTPRYQQDGTKTVWEKGASNVAASLEDLERIVGAASCRGGGGGRVSSAAGIHGESFSASTTVEWDEKDSHGDSHVFVIGRACRRGGPPAGVG